MNKDKKRNKLDGLTPKVYLIYGIFNFKSGELIYVDLDLDKITFEFDLEGYDTNEFDIVSFKVLIA